jgi:hypothetical protein
MIGEGGGRLYLGGEAADLQHGVQPLAQQRRVVVQRAQDDVQLVNLHAHACAHEANLINSFRQSCGSVSVLDPVSTGGPCRIGSRRAKLNHKHRSKLVNFIF